MKTEMKNRVSELKDRYSKATTQAEFNTIRKEMDSLAAEDDIAFSEAMIELAQETASHAKELVVREQLKEVIPIISMAYIAKTYFNKTRGWLNQRINGSIVNGKPAKFTSEEIEVLNNALQDISSKLSSIHVPA